MSILCYLFQCGKRRTRESTHYWNWDEDDYYISEEVGKAQGHEPVQRIGADGIQVLSWAPYGADMRTAGEEHRKEKSYSP